MTGAQAAERILRTRGLYDVQIVQAAGKLTDHYDPRNKTLALSESTYGSASIAAVSVAAHECGHALQHEKNYTPLTIRSYLIPFANFGSKAGVPIIFLGLILGFGILIEVGIWVFAAAVLFQFVTLPVEFNASTRGVEQLETLGILNSEELGQGKKVLRAAALTYVAAAASAVLQLLRFVLLSRGRSRD
jgi:Zn-dependent membrane protease YugP